LWGKKKVMGMNNTEFFLETRTTFSDIAAAKGKRQGGGLSLIFVK